MYMRDLTCRISTCRSRHMNSRPSTLPEAPARCCSPPSSPACCWRCSTRRSSGTALPAIVRDLDGCVALPVGRHRVPRAGHRLAAGLRAALGPPRAARAAADRHGALPARLGAVAPRRRTWTQLIALAGAAGPRRRRARGPLVHPRRRPLRRPPQRRAAGRARRADGPQLHRRAAGRRLPRRPRRLALGVPRQPPDRHRRAGGRRARAARARSAARGARRAARRGRDRAAHRRASGSLLVGLNERTACAAWSDPRTGGLIAARSLAVRVRAGRAARGRADRAAAAVRRPPHRGDHARGRDRRLRPVRRRAPAAALLPGRARRQRHALRAADLPAAARASCRRQRGRRADRQARRVPRADPRRPGAGGARRRSGSRPSTPRRPTGRASCSWR